MSPGSITSSKSINSSLSHFMLMLILTSFFSRKKQRQHYCRRHPHTEVDQQKLSTLSVCSNKFICLQNIPWKSLGIFHLIRLPTLQIGTDSCQKPDSRNPSHTAQYLITWQKDNYLSVKICYQKSVSSVSRNVIMADLCSVKVLMEDITTSIFFWAHYVNSTHILAY